MTNKYAACVLILNDKKEILAVSRKNDPNAFGIPGGKVEEGEPVIVAAARETLEETGYTVYVEKINPFILKCDEHITVTFLATIDTSIPRQEIKETGVVKYVDKTALIEGPFGEYNAKLFEHFKI